LTLQILISVNARVQYYNQIYKYAHARTYAHKQTSTHARTQRNVHIVLTLYLPLIVEIATH